jgi:pimeloyl-ACP methyl ester carboxylesterase
MAVVQDQKWVDAIKGLIPQAEEEGDAKFQARVREDPEKYAFSFDVDALSEPCPAPTLFLMGRQDSSVGYRDAWNILENYPRATFAVMDRAGHALFTEQEKLCRALTSEWIDRVEEYIATRNK